MMPNCMVVPPGRDKKKVYHNNRVQDTVGTLKNLDHMLEELKELLLSGRDKIPGA
jgi:hypothetical protein